MELLLFMPMLAASPCGSTLAEPPPKPEPLPSPEKSLLCPLEAPAEVCAHISQRLFLLAPLTFTAETTQTLPIMPAHIMVKHLVHKCWLGREGSYHERVHTC